MEEEKRVRSSEKIQRKTQEKKMQKYVDGSIEAGLELLSQISKQGQSWSQADIGKACGCSQARIEQIERNAMKKLKFRMRHIIKGLNDY